MSKEQLAGLVDYDAGLLNDYGGGNVEWWQDYIRAEIERANEFWRTQTEAILTTLPEPLAPAAPAGEVVETARQIIGEFLQCAAIGRPHGNLLSQAKDWMAHVDAVLSQQRAVPEVTDEMVEIVGKQLWRYWGDVKGSAARTYRNKTRKALEDALAATPSPEDNNT